MSATEARVHFGELIRRVSEDNDAVIVERGGKPQVVVLSLAEYERLRARQPEPEEWRAKLNRAHEQIRREAGPLLSPAPEELIRQMREERDAELLGLR